MTSVSIHSRVSAVGAAVWVVLAIALIARLGFLAATWNYPLVLDPWDYDRHAKSIAAGNGYPSPNPGRASAGETAYRPPAYPVFLAAIYKFTGQGARAARIAQAFLGMLTVALIGLLAGRIWGRRVALVAMAIAALYPPFVILDEALVSEALLLPLELGAILAVLRYRERPSACAWLIVAGALAGAATLTRANAAVILPALALGAWALRPRVSWRSLSFPVVLLLSAALTILPWTIRNAIEMDSFIPVTTQAGYAIGETYNPVARDDPRFPATWTFFRNVPSLVALERRTGHTEVEIGSALRHAGFEFVERHPLYPFEVGYWNTVRLLHLDGFEYARENAEAIGYFRRWVPDVGAIAFLCLAVLALMGALMRDARHAPLWFWLVPVLLWLSAVFVVGLTRFRDPIDPFLVMLAALPVSRALRRLRRLPDGRALSPSAQ